MTSDYTLPRTIYVKIMKKCVLCDVNNSKLNNLKRHVDNYHNNETNEMTMMAIIKGLKIHYLLIHLASPALDGEFTWWSEESLEIIHVKLQWYYLN